MFSLLRLIFPYQARAPSRYPPCRRSEHPWPFWPFSHVDASPSGDVVGKFAPVPELGVSRVGIGEPESIIDASFWLSR